MKQGFRKIYYALKTNPRFLIFMAGDLALFTVSLITQRPVWIWPILFSPLLYFIIDRAARHDLTLFFYVSRFCGRSYIYQRRDIKRGPCGEMRTALIWETRNLIDLLPAGWYVAVTHETVIGRLLKDADVTVLRCGPAYRGRLRSLQSRMLGCGKCPKKRACGLRRLAGEPRQFYYIEFNKNRAVRPNPVR